VTIADKTPALPTPARQTRWRFMATSKVIMPVSLALINSDGA
jgi:hypothetical protein